MYNLYNLKNILVILYHYFRLILNQFQSIQGNGLTVDLSLLNNSSIEDGPWGVYVFDSTSITNKIDYTVVETPVKVKNYIRIYYHRYGVHFNATFTPQNLSYSINAATFVVYFWNTTSNQVIKLGTSLTGQTHTSNGSSYLYEDYEINLPENTEGNLLLFMYGWKSYKADMGIGKIELLYSDQSTVKDTLFQPNSNQNTAFNGNNWYSTTRKSLATSDITSSNISDLEDELAANITNDSWNSLAYRIISNDGGWQLNTGHTGSGSTGPSIGQDGLSSSFIFMLKLVVLHSQVLYLILDYMFLLQLKMKR